MTKLDPARALNRPNIKLALQVSFLAVFVPILAAVFIVKPATLLLIPAVGVVLLGLHAPVAVAGLVLFLHVAMPVYIKAPLPGGVYDPPISTTLLLVMIGVGVLAYLARAPLPRPLARGGRQTIVAFLAFGSAAAFSLLDSKNLTEGMKFWVSIFFFPGAVAAMIFFACRRVADIERVTMFVIAGGAVACAYAVFEFVLGRNPLLEAFVPSDEVEYFTRSELGGILYRSFSVYGNPLQFGMVAGMIFPFAAIRIMSVERRSERFAFAATSLLLALGVFLTFSRGPILALLAGSIFAALIYRRFRPLLLGGMLAAAVALILAWPFLGSGISDRVNDVDNMTLRLKLWQTALTIFSDHPIRGVGLGNFSEHYLHTIRESHIGPFYEFGPNRVTEIRVAENTYLQLSAETGLLGLTAGTVFVLALSRLCLIVGRSAQHPAARNLAISIAVSGSIYLVNGMFITAYTFYFGTTLFIGLLMGSLLVLEREDVGLRAEDSPNPAARSDPAAI